MTAVCRAIKDIGEVKEVAERIARLLSGLDFGESGRRDGGGAEGESNEGAGVHVKGLCWFEIYFNLVVLDVEVESEF